jgi:hypothetical protein
MEAVIVGLSYSKCTGFSIVFFLLFGASGYHNLIMPAVETSVFLFPYAL